MESSKRKYQKKSEYWNQISQSKFNPVGPTSQNDYQPELCGEPFYVSDASVSTVYPRHLMGD